MADTLTYAKLCIPGLARGIVRPRLFELLDKARRGYGVWIVAHGGAGETLWWPLTIAGRRLLYIWYQLDQYDADPATFFCYLGIAAKFATPNYDVNLPLLTPESLPDVLVSRTAIFAISLCCCLRGPYLY